MRFGTLISSETKPLTEAVVKEHIALPPAPVERPFNQKRYDFLKGKIEQGLFINPQWVAGEIDGKRYRMNGQHSSRVLGDLNGSMPDGLSVHYDVYHVNTMDDFAVLFRQFDARQSSRSSVDVCAAYQGLETSLQGIPVSACKGLVEGYCWHSGVILGLSVPRSGDDRYSKLHEIPVQEFVRWGHRFWTPKAREVQRPGVVAAMLGTFQKEEAEAGNFWDEVVRDVNPDDISPSSKLAAELQRAYKDKTVKFKAVEYYSKCIKAWNAFRKNVSVRDLRVDLKKAVPEIE